ncbi:predicted protein [Arabidopsis lyrata subsp. lyrata]|uniref:Predicted protein n=1 Tax=Arabidopsis lyrata subsp. lyrata TaxID=81972 RepID=D7MPC9_ARALL|nr:predicted protein [Arabidopsis lyrata subsp. lyrata]
MEKAYRAERIKRIKCIKQNKSRSSRFGCTNADQAVERFKICVECGTSRFTVTPPLARCPIRSHRLRIEEAVQVERIKQNKCGSSGSGGTSADQAVLAF